MSPAVTLRYQHFADGAPSCILPLHVSALPGIDHLNFYLQIFISSHFSFVNACFMLLCATLTVKWRGLNMEEVRLGCRQLGVTAQWRVLVVLISKMATEFWVTLNGGSFFTDSATDKSSSDQLRGVFSFFLSFYTNALRWSGRLILPAMAGQCGEELTFSMVILFFRMTSEFGRTRSHIYQAQASCRYREWKFPVCVCVCACVSRTPLGKSAQCSLAHRESITLSRLHNTCIMHYLDRHN